MYIQCLTGSTIFFHYLKKTIYSKAFSGELPPQAGEGKPTPLVIFRSARGAAGGSETPQIGAKKAG
jgi:hypothetical protein